MPTFNYLNSSELDRLREALKDWERKRLVYDDQIDVLVAAARRFLALTETGRRIRWCEAHHAPESSGKQRACVLAVYSMSFAMADCEIVPKFLADYLTEKETE